MSSRLKRTTYRIAGPEKRRMLQALGVGPEAIETLDRLIVSARLRRSAKALAFRRRAVSEPPASATTQAAECAEAAPQAAHPVMKQVTHAATNQAEPAILDPAALDDVPSRSAATGFEDAAGAFDPYGLPLVPTFQRGGADALADRLRAVATVDHLRRMARAQQIALPADIRRGDVAPEIVRTAIVKAVAKRIADRRAAAG